MLSSLKHKSERYRSFSTFTKKWLYFVSDESKVLFANNEVSIKISSFKLSNQSIKF
uniref:Uncharacterized protein n=1 Tax=Physcomitrium patens TaxID=3218 RepID=A0A2K1KXN9_PHYPA|nr:hypothetical protein PHYPA_005549 [Physcomitrium patens]